MPVVDMNTEGQAMREETRQVVQDCATASHAGRIQFGEVVARLAAAGIERYQVDFVRGDATYYTAEGATALVPASPLSPPPTARFSAAGVAAAVRGAQAGSLAYPDFCVRAAEAGCAGYLVSITGRRVVYLGRSGDSHVEWFPGAGPGAPG